MGASLGYNDTPVLPDGKWHVHDGDRPQPRPVAIDGFVTLPAPSDATVLFDGTSMKGWLGRDGQAQWKVENGYMEVVPGTGDIRSEFLMGDCQLHLELAAPEVVKGEGQGRGNSGVFMMGVYEIQVLDNYENPTYADGLATALYGQCPPLVNACRKPGLWQSYDIIWEGPRFEGDKVTRNARVTVLHNGVVVHHAKELIGPTAHKRIDAYVPHPETGPLALQDHGDLVRYRNIWVRPIGQYDQA